MTRTTTTTMTTTALVAINDNDRVETDKTRQVDMYRWAIGIKRIVASFLTTSHPMRNRFHERGLRLSLREACQLCTLYQFIH